MSRFASLYNEAVRRGFRHDDIGRGMQGYLRRSPKLLPFRPEPDWQAFEKVVARIHIAFCRDSEVKWSEKLKDGSGTERQIDVTIRSKVGPHHVLGIVSCKHQKRPVSITDIEAFVTTKNDLNAGMAIIVSNSGYQEGAIAKAKVHDIRLWMLEEAEKAAWREEIRIVDLVYPMCDELKVHPNPPVGFLAENVRLDLMSFEFSWPDGGRRSLQTVVAVGMDAASQQCVPIPCWFDLEFPEGSAVHYAGRSCPIRKLELHFGSRVGTRQPFRNKNALDSPVKIDL